MGELGAIDQDVRFDFGQARVLAGELRSAATSLESQIGERTGARSLARAEWRGRFGDEFDGRVDICVNDAGRLAASLREAARMVDEMARLAQEEQDRREQAREWERNNDDGGFWDGVGDFVFGEDDVPPPPPPSDPPRFGAEAPNGGSPGGTVSQG